MADHASAAKALESLHAAHLYGQEVRVNWAFQSNHRDDPSGQSHIFVGDLTNDVTDAALFEAFSKNVSDCRCAALPASPQDLAEANGHAESVFLFLGFQCLFSRPPPTCRSR